MLHLLVEGDNDKDFFQEILAPCLRQDFDYLRFWTYAQETSEKINDYINSIDSIENFDYLFIADKDDFPCITSCIDNKVNEIQNLDNSKVLIVEKEIESWYLAGLDEDYRIDKSIQLYRNTDNLSKEQFNSVIPGRMNRYEFMFDIFENFDFDQAVLRNSSLKYFSEKLCN